MTILQGKDNSVTKELSELEKNLGIDLKLTSEGDLELNNLQDIALSVGSNNAAQAVMLKLNIEPGSLLYHQFLGVDIGIGDKIKDPFYIKNQILKSFAGDDRFENVNAKVNVLGDSILIELSVSVKGTGIQVPLRLVVPK